jgi:hypothetical protein
MSNPSVPVTHWHLAGWGPDPNPRGPKLSTRPEPQGSPLPLSGPFCSSLPLPFPSTLSFALLALLVLVFACSCEVNPHPISVIYYLNILF